MKIHARIFIRVLITTVIFVLLFIASLLTSALMVQGHVHPDNWVTTKYDVVTGVVIVLVYLVTVLLQVKLASKDKGKP